MKTIALAFRYLWSRPLAALLNLVLLTLGLASITFVVLVSHQVHRAFQRDLSGIDAVVGAKGSPLQLIMAGVLHIDEPLGNVPLPEVQKLSALPMVNRVIPLALADNYRGFRIVGTTANYLEHYNVRVAQGELWRRPLHAVLGAEVARTTQLKLGDSFSGTHGFGVRGDEHREAQLQVMGILGPCGCVLDRLVLTTVESVWRVHERAAAARPSLALAPSLALSPSLPSAGAPSAAGAEAPPGIEVRPQPELKEADPEISMALVTFKPVTGAQAAFQRHVNSLTLLQAASPTLEVSRLMRLLGVGTEVLRGLGAVLLLTAALSVFIALWNAVRERRADLAMLRMLGATPAKMAALLMCEAFWLALLASALGLLAGHAAAGVVGQVLQAQHSLPITGWLWVPGEVWIPLAAVGVAGVAALIPAVSAYRVDVAQLLNSR